MIRCLRPILLASTLACVIASPARADNLSRSSAAFDPALVLMANVREGTTAEGYLANLQKSFRAVDTDANGLDPDDVRRLDQRDNDRALAERATRRREATVSMTRIDRDADGSISPDELAAELEYESSGKAAADQVFRQLDLNADGTVKPDELPTSSGSANTAQFREIDTNANGEISFEELLAKVAGKRKPPPPVMPMFKRRDLDGDGRISLDELAGAAVGTAADDRVLRRRRDQFAHLFALDPDRDGRLLETELAAAFHRTFALLNSDGDTAISRDEFAKAEPQIARARLIAEAPVCAVPAPSDNARAVAVAARHGQLLSAVSIGSQDKITTIIDIEIEQGAEPLYLVVSSIEPVIWRLSGSTGRVEKMVVFGIEADASGAMLAATVGVPEKAVHFAEPRCFPAHRLDPANLDPDAKLAVLVGATSGVRSDAVARMGGLGKVALPSLQVSQQRGSAPAPEGFDPEIWWDAIGTWPRGLDRPDPAAIVTHAAVAEYAVLPGAVGLARLVAQGVLKPTVNLDEYRIMKPLARFPGGMSGGNAANFILPRGIPMPGGEQGHGCIYADSGAIIGSNTLCHRSPRGDALIARERADGRMCLYAYGGKENSCFPANGGPLVVTDTPKGRKLLPAEPGRAMPAFPPPPVALPAYLFPIDIIPAGLSLRW